MKPKVSVVIPCFNSAAFINDAVDSVVACVDECVIEIIIVDDGSVDKVTHITLRALEKTGVIVLYQENKGPAAARNLGIKKASGDYILFLDSDNKIRKDFIRNSVLVMEISSSTGVVYGKPAFFGLTTEKKFEPGEFNMKKILKGNYIDMCSLVRVEMLNQIGYLDEERTLIGHEDWELWIRVGSSGWRFKFIDAICYDYRVRDNSLIMQASDMSRNAAMKSYLYGKHWNVLLANYFELLTEKEYYENDKEKPIRSFVKYLYLKCKK